MRNDVYLETREIRNGWTILQRTGNQARVERLPRYIVSTPDRRHLEEFRRLTSARKWCDSHDDYAPHTFVACGCCDAYHLAAYDGDCRNDAERYDDLPENAIVID